MNRPEISRRTVLKAAAAAAASLSAVPIFAQEKKKPRDAPLPVRPFGTTGRSVCMLAMGTGSIAGRMSDKETVETIQHGLELGITYIDTAPSYSAEHHVGNAIDGHRKGLFIATKTLERRHDGAMRELEQSLKQLKTDRLDLWQVHSLGHERATPEQELAALRDENGVMKAMRRMKEQRVVDLIGFTGHTSPRHMQLVLDDKSLAFDAMLFIISAGLARDNQRGWEQDILPAGRDRGLGLIAMKVFGGGSALKTKDAPKPAELLEYVWRRDIPVANVGLYSKSEIDAAVAALRSYTATTTAPANAGAKTDNFELGSRDQQLRDRLREIELPFERAGYVDQFPRRQ
ncbi:MAG: aldo/keto reductase [Phycisphaerales bacterium]|nr:aldo/keto reductase [Phycisphaerales bacterium]